MFFFYLFSDSTDSNQKTPNDLKSCKPRRKESVEAAGVDKKEDSVTKSSDNELVILEEVDNCNISSNSKAENSTSKMSSHATATQALNLQSSAGQPSVVGVGHHRNYSQPSVGGVTGAGTNTSGDPWFLQSTGHQMQIPPQAPLRHNKRLAPQPVGGSILLQQTQHHHSQSQPHIGIPTAIPTGEFERLIAFTFFL